MASTKYLSLDGLTKYDGLIKTYLANADTATATAVKTWVGTLPEGQADVITYLKGLIESSEFSGKAVDVAIEDTAAHFTAENVEAALAELAVLVETLNGDATKEGSVKKSIADAVGELKIGETSYTDVKSYVDAKDAAIVKLIDGETGDLSDLTTEDKSTVVAAINEVNAGVKALADDLTFKGTTTTAVTDPAEGDLYYFNIPATETTTAMIGWKFWSKKDVAAGEWKALSDASLTSRVEALESTHAKKEDGTFNTVAEEVVAKVETLDTAADIALASAADGVVTIKAVKETDGIIAASTDTTLDVTLAKVATTGAAADVSIADADEKFDATNVEDALKEVKVEADTNKTNIATLNGDVSTDGSVLKMIKDNAKDGTYSSLKLYSWSSSDGSVVDCFTTSTTPSVGDVVYSWDGKIRTNDAGKPITITSVSSTDPITVANSAGQSDLTRHEEYDYTATVTIAQAIEDAQSGSTEASKVTVIKQATAEEGYSATYYVTQNNVQVGEKINIPKDFLVKSGKIVRYVLDSETGKYYDEINDPGKTAEIETLPTGVEADKDYLDFVVNAKDDPETDQHIYIDVTHLCNVYTGVTVDNGISVAVDEDCKISASVSGKAIARDNITDAFEADIAALEGTHAKNDDDTLKSVADEIEVDAEGATYTKADGTTTTIQDELQSLDEAVKGTNGAFVYKGDVASSTNLPTDASKGDAYLVNDTKTLYICTTGATTDPAADAVFTKLSVLGDFTLGNDTLNKAVDVKTYIDSRIFIGTADEIAAAKTAGTIDDTTFCIEVDEDADSFSPITDAEIEELFKTE